MVLSVPLYDVVAELPLEIEPYELERDVTVPAGVDEARGRVDQQAESP